MYRTARHADYTINPFIPGLQNTVWMMGCISNNVCTQQQLTFCKMVLHHTDCSGICASALKDITQGSALKLRWAKTGRESIKLNIVQVFSTC